MANIVPPQPATLQDVLSELTAEGALHDKLPDHAPHNEPLITSEWAVEVFKVAKARGLTTACISDGNRTPGGALKPSPSFIDA